jgi:hypothetical protein
MNYEEELTEDMTERQIYRLIVKAVRAGVLMSQHIYISMSLEKVEEIINNSMRVCPTESFGTMHYESPIGKVSILAISQDTNIVTVQN